MKTATCLGWCALALGVARLAGAAGADVRVLGADALATPPGASTAVVYLDLHNAGASADELVGARTSVAERVEIHTTSTDGTTVRMRTQPALQLPVGGSIEMHSGGTHLMLIGLRQALRAGTHFKLTLLFAHAAARDAEVTVQPLGRPTPRAAP